MIKTFIACLFLINLIPQVIYEPIVYAREPTIKEYIIQVAGWYGVNPLKALKIAKAESELEPSRIGDMTITCARTGKPVRARGIYQITECYHPEVSDKEAFDPYRNIEIGVKLIAENCRREFSTCR